MSNLPDRPRRDAAPSRLSSEQFDLVIRRAAELQASSSDASGADGLSEEETLRIGRELGLSAEHLSRALAEVHAGAVEERGFLVGLMGRARFSASRSVRGDAASITRILDAHLTSQQFMVVQRRLADATVYVKASGVLVVVERTATELFRRTPLLGVDNLHVSVRETEPGLCLVSLATDLSSERSGHAVGAAVMGGTFGGAGALVLGIAIAPPAALVAVPIAAASVLGWRWGYRATADKVAVQLESLLDRLEHGELAAKKGLLR
jgi:hypothetical protein